MKPFKLIFISLLASIFMFSCFPEDEEVDKSIFDKNITGQDDFDPKDLQGNVTADITLKANVDYLLTGGLRVKSGNTLKIEAGTTIKAKAGGSNTFIAIERGAKIEAKGTPSEPIKFTSSATKPWAGDWGGIVIVGKTATNKGKDVETEVGGLKYGGGNNPDPNDNSGTLSYVIIEHTGAKINGEKEFNGLSLYTVGSKTTINNIAIFNSEDDGIEFFGGTVNVTNLLCVNIKDDMFDFTEGYTGKLTNLFGVREQNFTDATADPRGIEGDSNSGNNVAEPISAAAIKDITVLNLAKNKDLKAGAEIRRGSKITIDNMLFATYGDAKFGSRIDTKDDAGNGKLSIVNSHYFGKVGKDKIGGKITGVVTKSTDAVTVENGKIKIKQGLGADFSKFSWTNYSISYSADSSH